jgi:hypothetical protein
VYVFTDMEREGQLTLRRSSWGIVFYVIGAAAIVLIIIQGHGPGWEIVLLLFIMLGFALSDYMQGITYRDGAITWVRVLRHSVLIKLSDITTLQREIGFWRSNTRDCIAIHDTRGHTIKVSLPIFIPSDIRKLTDVIHRARPDISAPDIKSWKKQTFDRVKEGHPIAIFIASLSAAIFATANVIGLSMAAAAPFNIFISGEGAFLVILFASLVLFVPCLVAAILGFGGSFFARKALKEKPKQHLRLLRWSLGLGLYSFVIATILTGVSAGLWIFAIASHTGLRGCVDTLANWLFGPA